MRLQQGLRNWAAVLSAVAAVGLLCWGPARAQPAAPPVDLDPEDTLVSELIVSAPSGGPAWWKVTKGESTVWILGAPQALPKGMDWDKAVTQRHLYGANVLLLPPNLKANIFELLVYFLFNANSFRSKQPLDQTLPPEMRARFDKARQSVGVDLDQVNNFKPFMAGMILSSRLQRPLNMENRQPEGAVARIARRMRVKQQRVGDFDIMPAIKDFAAASPEAQFTCLDSTLKQVEAGREPILAAARGWTKGDLRAAVSAERGLERCTAALPAISAMTRRGMAAATEAIVKALEKPGKSVAVVDLRPLLAKGGVIEQLQARGLTVMSPAAKDDSDEADVPDELKADRPGEDEDQPADVTERNGR